MKEQSKTKIVFWGTPELAVWALEEMQAADITPDIIVTTPPAPAGRGRNLTEPPAKKWADEHSVKTLQPKELDTQFAKQLPTNSLFLVFAYGKILPQNVLDMPEHGTLNIHPSMLPKLRGPSPIRTAILQDMRDEIGVSIIKLDNKVDHGPIVAQEKITMQEWPIRGGELDELLARTGGKLLADTVPKWIAGDINPKEQDHVKATFSKFFKKENALINLADDDYQNYLKICAYDGWPGAYFFKDGKRIKITKAHMQDSKLAIDKVIPEGEKEINFSNYN